MKPKGIDYTNVDWSQSNAQIARNLGIDPTSVFQKRKRLNIPPAFKRGQCPPDRRYIDFHLSSTINKPIRDLDYEFATYLCKDGRQKANKSYRKAVLDTYGPECNQCGYHKPPVSNNVHHIVPLSEGGDNTIRNGIVLCSRCHDEVHAGLISLT